MAKAAKKKDQPGWYAIRNEAGDVPEIFIYDEIGGWGIWASELIAQLNNIDAPRIKVRVFSPGGYVDQGIAIFNALRKHPAAIDIEVDSLAASIATVVVLSGDTIRIAENARFMIHDPWGGAVGTAEDMRKAADVMDIYHESIVATYAARTGISRDEIESMMAAETWLTPAQCVEMGFADEIDSIARHNAAQNKFSNRIMNSLKHVPDEFKGMFKSNKESAAEMISPAMRQALRDGKPAELPVPLDTTSVGSGRRDQGKKQEETMTMDEIKAQAKKAGIDIDDLQAKAGQLPTVTAERNTARTERDEAVASLEALNTAIGGASPEDVTAALKARKDARARTLKDIVANRRKLGMTGDAPEDVTAAEALYADYSDEQLQAEATNLGKAAATKPELKTDASDTDDRQASGNKYRKTESAKKEG